MINNEYSGVNISPNNNRGQSRSNGSAPSAGSRRAANKESGTAKKDSFFYRVYEFMSRRSTRSILGIALILFACYLTVTALSFFRSSGADQSHVVTESVAQMAQNGADIQNLGGPVGAKASHHLFVEGLGLGSIVILVYMVILALGLLGVKKIHFWSLTFKSLIFAVTLSYVFGLLTYNSSSVVPFGGYHGRYMNELMINSMGWIGAILINIMLVCILLIIYGQQLTALYNGYQEKKRTIQDRRQYEQDINDMRDRQVNDAISDGPINEDAQKIDVEPISNNKPVEDRNNIDLHLSDDFLGDAGEYHESEQGNSESVTTTTNATTDDSIDNVEPGFKVKVAAEIEQATGKPNEAVASQGLFDPRAELSRYRMPGLDLLHERQTKANNVDQAEQEENKERITKTLNDYGIQIQSIEATVGPTVTLYKIVPAEGVRIAKIKRLEDDIAMSLAALGIRIIAPIPGESNIGIEVPNKEPQTVSIRSILGSKDFRETKCELPMALGATIDNRVYITDLTKMPHLLVAGATGQGKSVGLNTIIASLLYKRHPSELKFVLVDPKMVEFSLYARLEKHYLAKLPDAEEAVITDPNKVVDTLNSLCVEMDNRYQLLKDAGCRSLLEYNEKFINRRLNPEKGHRYMPYIVMIVDEFADLMMMAGKAVEMPIARIAQKARAVGMHLIIATQRPSTNVITGMIKANFPGRIAFAVRQRVDSQTILDCTGANQLIGRGDMLISSGGNAMERVQCAFIDTDEVDAICHFIDDQVGFPTAYILPEPPREAMDGGASAMSLTDRDPLFEEIARLVAGGDTASTSHIQRKYAIGYNRAGKIMDQLEAAGIVGPTSGGKPRQVLVDPIQLESILSTL